MSSISTAQHALGIDTLPVRIISPYRVNPLGAHIDHQGGAVLAKTINQHTELTFWPTAQNRITLPNAAAGADAPNNGDQLIELVTGQTQWEPHRITFQAGETGHETTWIRFAQAAAAAFQSGHALNTGIRGYVDGAQIGAGLSSSASVVLAYLAALAHCNGVTLSNREMVELSRQVENDYMGLNNGVQDQMSIVFGKPDALTLLDVMNVTARDITDPASVTETRWLLCYSGFSRELINSGFNTRVGECRAAANALDKSASTLGQVNVQQRSEQYLKALPAELARRARHFFTETERVAQGVEAWQDGQWQRFGELMNQSCHSSITQYESGSQPMIDLHEIASATSGVFGSRFCGGGYGGCLLMLTDASRTDTVRQSVLDRYLRMYPEKKDISRIFVAAADSTVRVESA